MWWGSVFQKVWVGAPAVARCGARSLALALAIAACATTALIADDPADDLPPQLKAAQENALKWWRDPANHLTSVESTSTDEHGSRLRTIVFILRDPNGRSLAVSRAGSAEMQVFFQQRLHQLLRQATQQYALTQPQIDKLKLAAELDIARFNRRVQEAMQRMNQLGRWAAENRVAENQVAGNQVAGNQVAGNQVDERVAADEIAAAKSSLAAIAENCEHGLFDDQSLYTRVLATLLE